MDTVPTATTRPTAPIPEGPPALQRFQARHHEILERYLAGEDRKVIAAALGVCPETVGRVVASPLFQERAAQMRAARTGKRLEAEARGASRAREALDRAAPAAVEVLVGLMHDDGVSASSRINASRTILDKVFGEDDGSKGPRITITPANMNLIVTALRESQAPLKELPDGRDDAVIDAECV